MRHFIFALSFLIMLISGVFWLLKDDNLHPDVQTLIALTKPPEESSAFTYLLGIQVPLGQHPDITGAAILAQILENEDLHVEENSPIQGPFINLGEQLPLSDNARHCSISSPSCMTKLFQPLSPLHDLTKEDQALLERWHQFTQYRDYQILTQPGVSEYLPLYQYVIAANRVLIINSIQQAFSGETSQARQQLLDNLVSLRSLLAAESHLVGKMAFAKVIAEHIDALNSLQQHFNLAPLAFIQPLTLNEKSLRLAYARELTMIANLYWSMDSEPGLFDPDLPIPPWLARQLLKPGMSINALLPVYEHLITGSELTPDRFMAHINQLPVPQPESHWIRNPVGTILNRIASPDLQVYAIDIQDLDAKIQLFNAFSQYPLRPANQVLAGFTNPYHPDGEPMTATIEQHKVCISGPSQRNKLRCLHGFFNTPVE